MTLRIAAIGNIANNAYNMVKTLRRLGYDAQFIDDGLDTFPFSRPMWEDLPLSLDYAELGTPRAIEDWFKIERCEGWHDDGSVWRLGQDLDHGSLVGKIIGLIKNVIGGASEPCISNDDIFSSFASDEKQFVASNGIAHAGTVKKLKDCDIIIAFGVRAAACAFLANVPTIYFTYGGDMRVELMAKREGLEIVSRVMQKILHSPKFVIDAYGCDEEIHRILDKFSLLDKAEYAFLPNVNTDLFTAPWDKRRARTELGWPRDKTIFFMPSRIDRFWKASDRFVDAFTDIANSRDDMLLVFMGWGADYEYMCNHISDNGCTDNVIVLDKSVSKPLLKKYYAATDVVVDQFKLGSLGSVSFEALCMGKAVLTYFAPFNAANYPSLPPLFNVKTHDDIVRAITECVENPVGRDELGREGAKWYSNVYGSDHFRTVIDGFANKGPAGWAEVGGHQAKTLPSSAIPVPNTAGHVNVLAWPYPYRAGMTIANDCEYYTWDDFCNVHRWLNGDVGKETAMGPALGLPISDSFWFYSDDAENLGFSYFQGVQPGKLSPYAAQMAEMIQAGVLDTMHTYGGFDMTAGFSRRHAEVAHEELAKIGAVPALWSNHGNRNNIQNLRGQHVSDYALGDDVNSGAFHADITLQGGIKYFWLDVYSTNRFSLGNSLGRGFVDGLAEDDGALWGDRILCRDKLRNGMPITTFRRFRGKRGMAPDAENFGEQVSDNALSHLIDSGGAAIIYQHLGCFRNDDGSPHSRRGRPMPDTTIEKFEQIAQLYHGKKIWMATASTFVKYLDVVSSLRMRFEECEEGVDLILFKEKGALRESELGGVHLEFSNQSWRTIRTVYIEKPCEELERCIHYRTSEHALNRNLIFWDCNDNPEFIF